MNKSRETDQDWETWIHYVLTLTMQFILFGGMVWAVIKGEYMESFLIGVILLITLLPMFLGSRFEVYIPPELEMVAILFIFSSLFLGEFGDFYRKFWWWDAALHVASGVLLGIVGFLLVHVLNQHRNISLHMKPGFVALFSCAFAVSIGAFWEIFEFFVDKSFGMAMQDGGLDDTMWDLILDTSGSLFISLLGYAYLKYNQKSFLVRWITRFIERNPQIFKK